MIGAIQTAVEESKTEHQRQTGLLDRSVFLSTEVGEAQKEVLMLLGHYGATATVGAKERLANTQTAVIFIFIGSPIVGPPRSTSI